jgi:hypothetical protein
VQWVATEICVIGLALRVREVLHTDVGWEVAYADKLSIYTVSVQANAGIVLWFYLFSSSRITEQFDNQALEELLSLNKPIQSNGKQCCILEIPERISSWYELSAYL